MNSERPPKSKIEAESEKTEQLKRENVFEQIKEKHKTSPKRTPQKIDEIEKSRAISDAELLKGGAEYKTNEQGKVELEPTGEQINVAKEEMVVALESKIEKEKHWQEISAFVDEITDGLGKPVDEGIKQTVIALNAHEINTSQSCEGHFDANSNHHGYFVPWVDIKATNEPRERYVNEKQIYQKIADKYSVSLEDVQRANNEKAWVEALKESSKNEETPEYKKWKVENEKIYYKITNLLNTFYQDRNVSDEARIIAYKGSISIRLHNGGKFYIPISSKDRLEKELTEDERKRIPEILKLTQREMKDFFGFLKEKYFSK